MEYEDLIHRRRLENFLNSETKEVSPNHQDKISKDNFMRKAIGYFTGKSNIGYTYEYDELRDDIIYSFPRTFVGDIKNIKNYFSNLFSKSG
jgi:hypothetical protein